MNLDVQHEKNEAIEYVTLAGEVDAYTAPKLREVMLPLTEKEGTQIVVDLTNVQYMDSTGLGIFIASLKLSEKNGSYLKLQGLTSRVDRLFEITGLKDIMNIETKEGTR